MTGYGRAQYRMNDAMLTVEMKSVNHRFCEIAVRLPRPLFIFEDRIKKMVQSRIERGRVEVSIFFSTEHWGKRTLNVDWGLVQAYREAAGKLWEEYGIKGELHIQDLISIPELFEIEEESDTSQLGTAVLKSVSGAVEDLLHLRNREGARLAVDLQARLRHLSTIVEQITEFAPLVKQQYEQRLKQKVKDFLEQRVEIDEARLMNEVAVFADKSDIEEEITRLQSHMAQFEQWVDKEEGAVGRKLDFLLQEMNREMNTIGSKAQAVELSGWVVQGKSELEKIKEQVQNIE